MKRHTSTPWYTKPVKGFVYLTLDDAGKLLILSPAYAHLGCSVEPATEAQRKGKEDLYFLCPCHGAGFNRLGDAVVVVTRG